MKPHAPTQLYTLLRLAFLIPILATLIVGAASLKWPPWESEWTYPGVVSPPLDSCLVVSSRAENYLIFDTKKKMGVLTYIKRNYKGWIKEYKLYKLRKQLKSLQPQKN